MAGLGDPDYRIFLTLGDEVPADRLFALLEAVARLGSLNRAAADLGVSYRHAWGLVRRAEERLGVRLLDRRVGGAEGGGADLTPAAQDLLTRYRQFRAEVEGHAGILAGPGRGPDRSGRRDRALVLASTIGPVEVGLVPALAAAFLQETGIAVRPVAAGSGQALDMAREGRADLVLSHAPREEAAFVAAGHGTGRFPLMYNEFVLAGPPDDPARVRDARSAAEALRRIAGHGARFRSRGDRSGTHVRELELWEAAGVRPDGPWYEVDPLGAMGSVHTLREAARVGAYVLIDRATLLTAGGDGLAILLAGDPALRNEFSLIPVSPLRVPWVRHEEAAAFVRWATGPRGQALIAEFGEDRHGEPLFFPATPPGGAGTPPAGPVREA